MSKFSNVNDDIRSAVAQDTLAANFSEAVVGLFTVEYFRKRRFYNMNYAVIYCKPSRTVSDALLLDREVLALQIRVADLQVRTLHVAGEIIRESNGRLDPSVVIVIHSDKSGDEKLRAWGKEIGIRVFPIFFTSANVFPSPETIRRKLAQDLFAQDSFLLTGPVMSDSDFFGRRGDALELLRHLQAGRIRALFGLRKVGKTSLLNRVISLAREAGNPKIAMIDCSVDSFNSLRAQDALKAVAKAAKLAAHRGYSHISEAVKKTDQELAPVFDDIWRQGSVAPITLIFDEVDYITPASPTRSHWRSDFNVFWREFRAVYQEASRMQQPLSILLCGVSSHYFRVESFDGIENAVLHFIPEEYLSPFARNGSIAMLRDLFRRCGLSMKNQDYEKIAQACGDFPYWMRMAGSFIHRSVDSSGRPRELEGELVSRLIEQFVEAEGVDIARVALEDLRRKTREPIDVLSSALSEGQIPLAAGKLLTKYGLATQTGNEVRVSSAMVRRGAEALSASDNAQPVVEEMIVNTQPLALGTEEWAEELAIINRRRNILERKLRQFVQVAMKINGSKSAGWAEQILKSLPEHQRAPLSALSGDQMMEKLYWRDLSNIVTKNWTVFESTIGDKNRLESATNLLNDRPDAHAKSIDAADVALYRRELAWLEERLA